MAGATSDNGREKESRQKQTGICLDRSFQLD